MSNAALYDEISRLARAQPVEALAIDEAFWARIAEQYERDERFVQLNYGYYHPSARPVLEVEIDAVRELNRRGAHFKWQESLRLLEDARRDLAELAGAKPGEVAITRNASESLNSVIQGLPLSAGDEVVASDQDYSAATEAWNQRAQREGIRVRRVAIPIDPADDNEVVRLFEAEMTPRTRYLHVTHVVHLNGHVLPVEKLCALGRGRGVPVLVDAAHSFAQFDYSIGALGCDYLTASLHKWLGAPLGTGLLYVRADRIAGLRPLFGDTQHPVDDIRRLERLGNRPDSAYAGLREAIRWHRALGTSTKRARLAHLHRSWAEPLRAMPRFHVLTPRARERHGAIGLMTLDGAPAETLFQYLLDEHGLFTAVQKLGPVTGVRITPGLPTTQSHITKLLEALGAAATRFV